MLATLRVSQVGAIVLVNCQAQAALEAADMIFEEVGVFVEVDGFECEFAEAFATVGVCGRLGGYASAAKFGARSVLWFLVYTLSRGVVRVYAPGNPSWCLMRSCDMAKLE